MAPQAIQQLQFLLTSFIPCFAQVRTFQYLVEFFWGIVCATTRKTVTQIFLTTGGKKHYTNYHRFLKNYRWKILEVARCLFILIQSNIAPLAGGENEKNLFLPLDSTFSQKSGKKMDGVDSFFDHSSKPNTLKYIWGHCIFLLGVLYHIPILGWTYFPFLASIYLRKDTIKRQELNEPFVPMLQKSVEMILSVKEHCKKRITVVADAFFSKKNFFKPLLEKGVYILSRMRHDAVAYEPAPKVEKGKRGRPARYGKKVKLKDLLNTETLCTLIAKIGRKNKEIQYVTKDLLVRGFPHLIRFMVIKDRITVILMTTNLELSPKEMIEAYCARFQIEFSICDLKQSVGFEDYQVRRLKSIDKFLNITVLVYSLLKIIYAINLPVREVIDKIINHPWRSKQAFSFEQLLAVIRSQFLLNRFFDTLGSQPQEVIIPLIPNIVMLKAPSKC